MHVFYFKVLRYFYTVLFLNFTYYFSYSDVIFFNVIISNVSYLYSLFILLFFIFTLLLFQHTKKLSLIKNVESLIGFIGSFSCLYYYMSLNTLAAIIFLFELQTLIFIYILASSYPNILIKNNFTNILLTKFSRWFFNSMIFQFWISFLTSVFFVYSLLNFLRYTSFVEWDSINIFYYFNSNFFSSSLPQNWLLSILPVMLALLLKLGTFPFFLWKPEIYKSLNVIVLYLYMSIYMFSLIFFFIFFLYSYLSFFLNLWSVVVYSISVLGLILLSLFLYSITELRPFLAYTSAIHICYILSAVYLKTYTSFSLAIFYLCTYLFYTVMFFVVMFTVHGQLLWFFTDLHKIIRAQIIVAALFVFMLGVSGIPPFFGFIAKISIASLMLSNGEYFLFFLIIASGIYVSFFYIQNYRFYGTYQKRITYSKPILIPRFFKHFLKIIMYFIFFNILAIPLSSDLFIFSAFFANLI